MVLLPPKAEGPQAHFNRGRLHLGQNETTEALAAYLAGIGQMRTLGRSVSATLLQDELDFLARTNPGPDFPKSHDLVRRLLFLAIAAGNPGAPVPKEIDRSRPERVSRFAAGADKGVLIVTGEANEPSFGSLASYEAILERALAGASGWVICAGAASGIPALVGKLASTVAPKGRRKFCLLGYRPHPISLEGGQDASGYDAFADSGADLPGPLEPLMAWTDLLLAGIRSSEVQLLGLGGGDGAAFEMSLALALGARVGAVRGTGGAADAILADPQWADHARLVPLPGDGIDAATMRALVRSSRFCLSESELDRLAKSFHRNYLKMTPNSETDLSPERERYYELRPDLRDSNRDLVRYAAEILGAEGFKLVEHQGPAEEIAEQAFTTEQIERMAELEHGRWCIERLTNRWVPGESKDTKRKVSPWLKPYAALDDDAKQLDREAIRNYSRFFKAGGYAIVKA